MKVRFRIIALAGLLLGFAACTNDTTPEPQPENDMVPVRFSAKPYVEISTRATSTGFENGDEIGISCVDTAATHSDSVRYEGENYASNLRYHFSGNSFLPNADSIMQYRYNVNAFTYYFVYPYKPAASAPQFAFSAINNQALNDNYTKSDLALQKLTTRDTDIVLRLKRMMANVDIHVTGFGMKNYTISASIANSLLDVNVDLNAQKVTTNTSATRKTVFFKRYITDSDTETALHAIIAPQQLTSAQEITVTVNETKTYVVPLPWTTVNIPSGYRLTMNLELEDDGVIRLTYGGVALTPIPMD